ncbi:MAG: LamG-like jellyroll fold domain-containing protein [Planctomycetota bacterium]
MIARRSLSSALRAGACAWLAVGLTVAATSTATAQIQVAGELFVSLDAGEASTEAGIWPNQGSLEDFVMLGIPIVTEINGATAVVFNGGDQPGAAGAGDAFQCQGDTPAGLTGVNPTASIEAWVWNLEIAAEETILAWGRRGGGCGSNMSFNYGRDVYFGAVGHWCHLPGPDIGWGEVPVAGQWHHVVYTYDGTTTRVYVDGAMTNSEDDSVFAAEGGGTGLNTWPLPRITIAAQLLDDASTIDVALGGTLAIGRVRIHDEVLTDAQIQNNYDLERPEFPIQVIPPTFLNAPAADSAFAGDTYSYALRVEGFPAPTLSVVEPAGAAIAPDGTLTYAIPSPAPASFTVTVRATNEGGTAEATWVVTVKAQPGELEIAEELIVDLDAGDETAGLDFWESKGTVVEFQKIGEPVLEELDGVTALTFNSYGTQDAYQSVDYAPDGIIGLDPTRSIEVWVYNPKLLQEETILSFGHRGGGVGTNMSFNYGFHATWGAVGHWDWPDIGWATNVPRAGRWHHLAYTYDGTTTRVYVDGEEANSELCGSGIINTWAGKISLAVQTTDGTTPEWGIPGSLSIARVRIHDGVLTPSQIRNNYLLEKDGFPVPPEPMPEKLAGGPVHRYSFDEDATDSVSGADGTVVGSVTFEGGQAVLRGNAGIVSGGGGSYIDLPNGIISQLNEEDEATFEAWATWNGPLGSAWQRIFDFGTSAGGENASTGAGTNYYLFLTPWSGDGSTRFGYRTGVGTYEERSVNGAYMEPGVEYHVALVWDGPNATVTLYVNGEKIESDPGLHFALREILDVNNWLGRSQWRDLLFDGSYNEFRIYDYVLSDGQVLNNYLAGPDVVDSAPPRAVVERKVSKLTYGPREAIDVSLEIALTPPDTAITVREVLPKKAAASAISDGGSLASGAITWNLTGLAGAKAVTYKLAPDSCAGSVEFGRSTWNVATASGRVTGAKSLSLSMVPGSIAPWEATDVGTAPAAAGAEQRLGEHEILVGAAGAGARSTNDDFHFVHVGASGDFEIGARIDCVDDPGGTAQGGVMVRESTDPSSAFVYFYLAAPQVAGTAASLRGSVRRETNPARLASIVTISQRDVSALPVWIRLRRAEGKILFERSDDGVAYAEVASREVGTGTSQVNLPDAVRIGLATASQSGTARAHYTYGAVTGAAFGAGGGANFRRGDANADGGMNITDGIFVLNYLFLGGPAPTCLDAADSNGDNALNITDGIYILNYLFLGGTAPPEPGPDVCGPDPDADEDQTCESYTTC